MGATPDRATVPEPFTTTVMASGALFIGLALLMLGNGLQGSLLGVRASQEDFGSVVIGLIMAAFFTGFLLGSVWTVHALRRVGYVRVFAALAAVASVAILVQELFVVPLAWGLMRFVTGLCFAGIFVVSESWLNNRATNRTRGRLLAVYMVVMYLGQGGGQLLLNLADPSQADLFILSSILISVAVVPLLLSATPAPEVSLSRRMSVRRLFRVSPFGAGGVFIAGLINGTIMGMGAVYAHDAGLSVSRIALFMGALICGGALLQWPLGRLSDRVDRRLVIIGVAFAGAASALLADQATGWTTPWMLGSVGLFGGLAFALHSLNLAHTNDCLEPAEMLGASSSLVLLLGVGSVIGPLAVGAVMSQAGAAGFFWWLAVVQVAFGLFGLGCVRYFAKRASVEPSHYVVVPAQTSSVGSAAIEDVYATQERETAETPDDGEPEAESPDAGRREDDVRDGPPPAAY
ncbi:MFS transporter [Halomonas beimenensis]|uniref:MFS transporter n=1 Tax=Halomonas beimenensis TaxID=475662 RepID=UPI0031D9D035